MCNSSYNTPRRHRRDALPWSAGRGGLRRHLFWTLPLQPMPMSRGHPPLSRHRGRLPLLPLSTTAPKNPRAPNQIRSIKARMEDAAFPRSASAESCLDALPCLSRPSPMPHKVRFATMGNNLLQRCVAAGPDRRGLVQIRLSPLNRSGGARGLGNAMNLKNGQQLFRWFLLNSWGRGSVPRRRNNAGLKWLRFDQALCRCAQALRVMTAIIWSPLSPRDDRLARSHGVSSEIIAQSPSSSIHRDVALSPKVNIDL